MQTFNSNQMNGWSCSPKHGPAQFICSDGGKLFKNIPKFGWVVLPQTRPSSLHGVEKFFRLDVMQPFQKLSSWWLGRAPQHPLSRPSLIRGVKHLFVLMLCTHSTTFKWMAGRAPQTRSSSFYGVESTFCPDAVKFFKNIQSLSWIVLPQTPPSSFHGV